MAEVHSRGFADIGVQWRLGFNTHGPASALPFGADAESAPKPPEAAAGATKAL
jgi:hypothetical protein